MALFNKADPKADYSANVTTIAAGAQFTGNLEIACSLHIDGEFSGDINSTNTVSVGKTGVLNGEVRAQKFLVAGRFFGNADCESIELASEGAVEGKLTAFSLAIDSDSSFEGESVRKKTADAPPHRAAIENTPSSATSVPDIKLAAKKLAEEKDLK